MAISATLVVLLAVAGAGGAATIRGGAGNDLLRGTSKADRLLGGKGHDVLRAQAGNDVLQGGPGNDRLYGERGSDRLTGGKGLDRLLGGGGNDMLLARDGARDLVACGPGRDRVVGDALDVVGRDCETVSVPAQMVLLSVSPAGQGSVTSSPTGIACGTDCRHTYRAGTAVTLTATPASGWVFAGWSGGCVGTTTCVVFLDAPSTVRATFTASSAPPAPSPPAPSPPAPPSPPLPPPTTYNLTVTVAGSGRVTSSPGGIDCGGDCSEAFAGGTSVTLTPIPGGVLATFIGWAGACTGTGSCSVTMDGDKTVVALFAV